MSQPPEGLRKKKQGGLSGSPEWRFERRGRVFSKVYRRGLPWLVNRGKFDRSPVSGNPKCVGFGGQAAPDGLSCLNQSLRNRTTLPPSITAIFESDAMKISETHGLRCRSMMWSSQFLRTLDNVAKVTALSPRFSQFRQRGGWRQGGCDKRQPAVF